MPELAYERLELLDLQERQAELEHSIDRLSESLIPFYVERKQVREVIMATHVTRTLEEQDGKLRTVVVRLVLGNRTERIPLFRKLDQVNHAAAPQVELLRRYRAQLRELKSQIKKLSSLIAKQDARTIELKAGPGPVALLDPPYDPETGELL